MWYVIMHTCIHTKYAMHREPHAKHHVRADHDLALGIEQVDFGTPFPIGSEVEPFNAEREFSTFSRGCPATFNVHSGLVDAGMVYGTIPEFLTDTLRLPGSCNLRVSVDGDGATFPPLTTFADDEGRFFFLAGDFRLGEHSFLFAQHTVRHPDTTID